MTHDEAVEFITVLVPETWKESFILNPYAQAQIPAPIVFDWIREHSDPPISKEEFNEIADSIWKAAR